MLAEPYVHKMFTGKVQQMGTPGASDPMDRPWESASFKKETDQKRWLGETSLNGDEVGDKKNHGGPEKALFACPIKHYTYWKEDLARDSMRMWATGENSSVIVMSDV